MPEKQRRRKALIRQKGAASSGLFCYRCLQGVQSRQYPFALMTSASSEKSSPTPGFLRGGGETGRLLREVDWDQTALGSPAGWPPGLRVAVRLLLNNPAPSCLVWGPQRLAFWNDAYLDLLHKSKPGRALGGPAAESLEEVWSDIGPHIERVMQGHDATGSEFSTRRVTADGLSESGRWICSYAPVDDGTPDGGAAGVMKTCAWIPLHQQSLEERLSNSQDDLKLALAGGRGVGTWDWDVQTDRVFADAAFARMFGVAPQAARDGAPISEFFGGIHGDDIERVRKHIQHAVETGTPFREEYRLVAPDGQVHWLLAEGRCKHSDDGTPMRFKGLASDITERKLMQQELLELNTDLESKVNERASERGRTWQVSPDMLGVCNMEGHFETSNPAWQKTLGWSAEELRTKLFSDLVHPDDLDRTLAVWQDLSTRSLPALNFKNRFRCKDGSYRWLSWVSVPEDGKIYSSARDITEDKEREQALAIAESSLRQAQKMEAVGQLTGGLAHDFNNLLTTVNGSLELIERSVAAGQLDKVDRLLSMARGAVKRAAALTHRLLAFSRLQTLAPKPVDVNRLTTNMEEMIRRTVGPAVELECVGAVGLWATLADPGQLENALLNLCINARDAMPDGGRLTIETANRSIDGRSAGPRDLAPGQYVSLCVTDTGVGMSAEVVAKAFDPFFTTKPLGSGTGLGLSMVYGFAHQSGGQVRIYSEVGIGTTVCLYLPRHHGGVEDDAVLETTPEQLGAGEVVLVIDDEPSIRSLLVELLAEAGYQPLQAQDGPSGLRLLQRAGRVDLLITDVGLPGGMNGRQVADAARASRPDLKVLFITGYAENAVVGNGHVERWMSVLTKPFDLHALTSKVSEILAS